MLPPGAPVGLPGAPLCAPAAAVLRRVVFDDFGPKPRCSDGPALNDGEAEFLDGNQANSSGLPVSDENFYSLGLDFGWEIDLWGRVRRAVESSGDGRAATSRRRGRARRSRPSTRSRRRGP